MAATWTSIELTGNEALVAQMQGGKKPAVLRAAARIPLPDVSGLDAQEGARLRGESLRDGLRREKIKASSAVFIVPKRLVTVRRVVLPSTSNDELIQMARFEAERHIPFNAERHVVSHHVVQKDDIEGSQVIIAAADGPDLREVVGLAQAAGIEIEAIDVSSLAHFNALAAASPPQFSEETVALLHLGAQTADISITSLGRLVFTRSAPLGCERLSADLAEISGSRNIPLESLKRIDPLYPGEGLQALGLDASAQSGAGDAEGTDAAARVGGFFGRVALEVQRSYDFASREFECPPIDRVYLSGEAARWGNLDALMQTQLNVDVDILNPFHPLQFDESLGKGALSESGVFAAPVGALARKWRPEAVAVDLAPADYHRRARALAARKSIVTTAVLALAAASLLALYFHKLSTERQLRVENLRDAVEILRPQVDELRDKEKQLDIINRYRRDERSALAVLDTISSYPYMPAQVAVTQFDFRKGHAAYIYGHALGIHELNRFITDLQNASFEGITIFSEVHLNDMDPGAQLGNGRDKVLGFRLTCNFPES
jgi:type IV pilus assembly protein PilM